jgi:prophage DNA circulation protein
MAEFEFAGMTFRGGKMMIVLTALSTLGGATWAGFEFYKDYMDMREIVQNIDVDTIENRNQQIEAALKNNNQEITIRLNAVQKSLDDIEKRARENKVDLNDQINNLDDQVRRVEKLVRDTENEVRQIIQNAEERFDNKRDALQNQYDNKASALRDTTDQKIKDVEDRLNSKLQRALDNPLAN